MGWWADSVPCPTCDAEVGKRCRALSSGRSTDFHVARIEAYHLARVRGEIS